MSVIHPSSRDPSDESRGPERDVWPLGKPTRYIDELALPDSEDLPHPRIKDVPPTRPRPKDAT